MLDIEILRTCCSYQSPASEIGESRGLDATMGDRMGPQGVAFGGGRGWVSHSSASDLQLGSSRN